MGETTVDRIRRLQKVGDEGRAVNIPDRMDGYVGLDSLPGLRVSIDPAHGGRDRGFQGPNGTSEKDVNLALGTRLAALLEDAGAEVLLLRESDLQRAALRTDRRRQRVGAAHPHLPAPRLRRPTRRPRGAASYYFANSVYLSKAGKRLAGYLVDALSRELGRVDLQKHGRNYACLREVKPLAVMVEPGFLSNPEEGRRLSRARDHRPGGRGDTARDRGLPGPAVACGAAGSAGSALPARRMI